MTDKLAVVGAVFGTLFVAHQIADHWVQTGDQAASKGKPGSAGRLSCIRHVLTYTVTVLIALGFLSLATGWGTSLWRLWTAMAVNGVTHYIVDRRTPLARMARWLRMDEFLALGRPRPGHDDNPVLGTGAYALDQSWHYLWLWVTALIIAT